MEGDYIGFTNEGDVGVISFSYNVERRTLFADQRAAAVPSLGDEFVFDSQLPAEYSIAVQLSAGQFNDVLHSKSNYRPPPQLYLLSRR